ncbi:oxidoreductase [Acuticoccus mangrovi]|uniref:SDR family NAD(P)-dependent oxidoreductase n=1 Tax=Acuticoccus mangrovi TaxID=2796142 RepID=A0A934IMW2_9HYPH|nr:oxidoreductase [Acuticoccus mangrovi]MBJ3775313.1 SDR family NAD(P)-dependent oxidoreductase [Acuticoccus mangrovi]
MPKTWLITGCSSGFGSLLAEAAASRGDRVVATARDVSKLAPLVAAHPESIVPAVLDVTRPETARAALALANERFGGIDILVNNAGYGFIGALEEGAPEEYRPLFETNVFGLIETTRAALPTLRARGGVIVNFSSTAGISGSAGSGYYNATKFAVEGLSEALAQELAPFGIRVMLVEPGPFRTDFLGRSITVASHEMPEYAETAGRRRRYRETNDGRQAGDPAKAIAVLMQALDAESPPLRLPLGARAFQAADAKLASLGADVEAWRSVGIATDFDPA